MSAKGHANSQGVEMSQSTTTSVGSREVVREAAPTSEKDERLAAPVLITEQEVLLGTRAATLPPKVSAAQHRWIAAIRVAAGSLHLPPPRQRFPMDTGYLERSRMAREMDRL